MPSGEWYGDYLGEWSGASEGTSVTYADAGLEVTGIGIASMSPVADSSVVPNLASLGGFSPSVAKNPVSHVEPEEVEIVEEAIPEAYISRIRNEFLSEAMAKDLINRAKQRKSRAEEEALLLIL